MFEDAIIYAVLIFVSFAGLLPSEVDEELFWIGRLLPTFAGREDAFNEFSVVSDSDVVAEGIRLMCGELAFGNSVGTTWGFLALSRNNLIRY